MGQVSFLQDSIARFFNGYVVLQLPKSFLKLIHKKNLLGELVDSWGLTALRVTDLAITPDSKRLIVLGMPFARNDAGRIEQIDAALGPPSTVLGTTQQIDHPVCRVIIYDFATKKQETCAYKER